MSSPRYIASVTVELTVELSAPGSYGSEWNVSKMHEQCVRETLSGLQDKFPGAKIKGEPRVMFCTFKEGR